MRSGTEQHAKLEAEMAGETVVVKVESREDKFAIRLVNMMQALNQLLQGGMTREFCVCGFLQVRFLPPPECPLGCRTPDILGSCASFLRP